MHQLPLYSRGPELVSWCQATSVLSRRRCNLTLRKSELLSQRAQLPQCRPLGRQKSRALCNSQATDSFIEFRNIVDGWGVQARRIPVIGAGVSQIA